MLVQNSNQNKYGFNKANQPSFEAFKFNGHVGYDIRTLCKNSKELQKIAKKYDVYVWDSWNPIMDGQRAVDFIVKVPKEGQKNLKRKAYNYFKIEFYNNEIFTERKKSSIEYKLRYFNVKKLNNIIKGVDLKEAVKAKFARFEGDYRKHLLPKVYNARPDFMC